MLKAVAYPCNSSRDDLESWTIEQGRWESGMKNKILERRFRRVLEDNGWLKNTRVLLGVSGGSDSMALLHLYRSVLPVDQIVVAHMDHGLRRTAARDRDFVISVCGAWGIRSVVEIRDVAQLMRRGESIEAAGRRLRYDF